MKANAAHTHTHTVNITYISVLMILILFCIGDGAWAEIGFNPRRMGSD